MKKLIAHVAFAMALATCAGFISVTASAASIDYALVNVTFADGGTATGTFSWDTVTETPTAFNVTTTATGSFGGFVYNSSTSSVSVNPLLIGPAQFALAYPGFSPTLVLRFANPLSSGGTDFLLTDNSKSYECMNCSPFRLVAGGAAVEVVPVPAAVWLFGSALGVMGWMRRKAH
jgi:hypothetical protein